MKQILILDIETTGFMKQKGSIVEVGIVSLDLNTGNIRELFDSVCYEEIFTDKHLIPPMGWIFKNSNLTVEEVMEAPFLPDLLPKIQNTIDSYPLGVTAFNKDFDFTFLKSRGVKFPKELPCIMKTATDVCKVPSLYPKYGPYKWPSVEEAWDYFFPNTDYVEQHRGTDDAIHEAKILHALYKLGKFKV